jgi:hypothetical protein
MRCNADGCRFRAAREDVERREWSGPTLLVLFFSSFGGVEEKVFVTWGGGKRMMARRE